ncbi:hypothetical protein E2C01_047432 [Portunus trituberculatus]|uniref:Uncharacterized protein n=1 Tax=Portunus trituberculatus TaxID=210409 RepID=A0A5B7G7K2_PORTR|nr:hypothetical protein [Portunus trituberculatus]
MAEGWCASPRSQLSGGQATRYSTRPGTNRGELSTHHKGRPGVSLLLVPLGVRTAAATRADLGGKQLEETLPEGGAAGGVEDKVDAEVRVLQLHEELLQVPHQHLVCLLLAAPETAEEGVDANHVAVGERGR